jgi:hypothetical protein
MRIVGKFKNQDIRLETIYVSGTYGGFLSGPSKSRLLETNKRLLEDIQTSKCNRVFGYDFPVYLHCSSEPDFLSQRLPPVYVMAYLSSGALLQDDASNGSHLILIWLQELQEDAFVKVSKVVSEVDWEKHAKDFQF